MLDYRQRMLIIEKRIKDCFSKELEGELQKITNNICAFKFEWSHNAVIIRLRKGGTNDPVYIRKLFAIGIHGDFISYEYEDDMIVEAEWLKEYVSERFVESRVMRVGYVTENTYIPKKKR